MPRKSEPERRESPLRGPGGRGLDPHVQATLQQAARRLGQGERRQYNLSLPEDLMESIRAEAAALVGHKRRGFADLVTVLIEHGWTAYQAGELEVELQPTAVQMQIVGVKKR